MPDTKNPNETVDTGNPGDMKPGKDADRSRRGSKDMDENQKNAGDSAGDSFDDKGSVGRKPGEADAPNVPEKAKPSFE